MAEAMAEARRAMSKLMRILAMRGAGLLLLAAAFAALLAVLSYHSGDPSINNANGRDAANWMGPLGAVAADLLLQSFGIAAVCALAPLLAWGACALMGINLRHAMWRLVAWPLGALLAAAGLGVIPAPDSLPAGAGGLIGIAAAGLSAHVALVWNASWLTIVLPLVLLLVGLPLSFLATGLRARLIARGLRNIGVIVPAGILWLGGILKIANFRRVNDEDAETLVRAIDEQAIANVTRAAHRIKGACRMIGARSLAAVTEAIERASRADDWTTIRGNMAAFDAERVRLDRWIDGVLQ